MTHSDPKRPRPRDEAELRRIAGRGEALLDRAVDAALLLELPADLIPDFELPRDLFELLMFLDQAQRQGTASDGAQDAYAVLRMIRAQAWQGYTAPLELAAHVRRQLPTSDVARLFGLYCEELAAKHSAYLFLPIVSRIDRHQAAAAPWDEDIHELIAAALDRHDEGDHRAFAYANFALAPHASERTAFQLASMLTGRRPRVEEVSARLMAVAAQLRRLAEGASGATFTAQPDIGALIDTVSTMAPWIWLEALFVVENWVGGSQHLDRAFRINWDEDHS
jgi:hypothetical protein